MNPGSKKDSFLNNRLVRVLVVVYLVAPPLYREGLHGPVSVFALVGYCLSAVLLMIIFIYLTMREMKHPLAQVARGVAIIYGLALAGTAICFFIAYLLHAGPWGPPPPPLTAG